MKVKLFCATRDINSKESKTIEVDDDITDEKLELLAKNFLENVKEPAYWYEKIDEDNG
jgi:hypothetical protein